MKAKRDGNGNRPRAAQRRAVIARRRPLGLAISAALAGMGAASAAELEEIVVTATKRAASAQDVAVSVQAVTGDTVRDLGVETFDEYVEYLPNVVGTGNGPGKKELYIRGSATEQSGVTITAAQGSAPGVALYVDELPVSLGGRNLDVYAVDLERIEVLSGPQGTLFGASSQSGNLRLITRKPDHGQFGAGFNAKFASTTDGADSTAGDAWLNVPLSDALAARVVVYNDNQGGWIDNVPGTFTPSGEVIDRNNAAGYGPPMTQERATRVGQRPPDSVMSVRNDALVQDDWNEASYRGGRFSLAWSVNDNWDVLLQHTAQTLEAEGSFLVDTSLDQDYAAQTYTPDYNRDEFGLTAWTIGGRIGNSGPDLRRGLPQPGRRQHHRLHPLQQRRRLHHVLPVQREHLRRDGRQQLLRPAEAVHGGHRQRAHHPRVPDLDGPEPASALPRRRVLERRRDQPHRGLPVRVGERGLRGAR